MATTALLAARLKGQQNLEWTNRLAQTLWQGVRYSSTDLRSVVAEKIPAQQERLKQIKKSHADKVLGEVTVGMCIGGMRGIKVR